MNTPGQSFDSKPAESNRSGEKHQDVRPGPQNDGKDASKTPATKTNSANKTQHPESAAPTDDKTKK